MHAHPGQVHIAFAADGADQGQRTARLQAQAGAGANGRPCKAERRRIAQADACGVHNGHRAREIVARVGKRDGMARGIHAGGARDGQRTRAGDGASSRQTQVAGGGDCAQLQRFVCAQAHLGTTGAPCGAHAVTCAVQDDVMAERQDVKLASQCQGAAV